MLSFILPTTSTELFSSFILNVITKVEWTSVILLFVFCSYYVFFVLLFSIDRLFCLE